MPRTHPVGLRIGSLDRAPTRAPPPMRALREMRIARGIGQVELAKCIGRDAGALSRWETGARHPSLGAFLDLCTALGVEVALVERK